METRLGVIAELRRRMREAEGGFGDAGLRAHRSTGIEALDAALPGGGFPAGALVEVFERPEGGGASTFACIAARAAARDGGRIAWIDAAGDFYPPAALALGLDADRLLVVRPATNRSGGQADALWAFFQTIRSRAVAASVAALRGLSMPMTRRLQLAAEEGGGVALLLRPEREAAAPSAAAVRLRAAPVPSDPAGAFSRALGPRRFAVEMARARGGLAGAAMVVEVDDAGGAVPRVSAASVGSGDERRRIASA